MSHQNTVGSIWRKWDLHIHTPISFHWTGERLDGATAESRDKILGQVVAAMNATDVAVFGIMDYWTFEGFIALREYLRRHPKDAIKCILPGIEIRLEAPTDFRLNCHAIFPESISDDRLREFLASLEFRGIRQAPSREAFIKIGRDYGEDKRSKHGFSSEDVNSDERMCRLGMMTAEVTRDSFEAAVEKFRKDGCLFILPFDTSDGLQDLDWKKHPFSDQNLMRAADIFEAKDPETIDLFLGRGHKNKKLETAFKQSLGGRSKPVVRGSDAHATKDYGKYPNDRITWFKADPNFAGLKQVCHEPLERCWIGLKPQKLIRIEAAPTKHIRCIEIAKVAAAATKERWFENLKLPLNPGLVAIIGNKGSGKSALADIVALLGNTRTESMEFLTSERFRKTRGLAESFEATLEWNDGSKTVCMLSDSADATKPERIRYLPQSAIEKLCNEISASGGTAFEAELKKVIFSHVPSEDRLRKASLDELLAYKTSTITECVDQLRSKMGALNREIAAAEQVIAPAAKEALTNALSLKVAELAAHNQTVPQEVVPPQPPVGDSDADATADSLRLAISEVDTLSQTILAEEGKRAGVVAEKAALDRLMAKLKNLQAHFDAFVQENENEFKASGFDLGKVTQLKIDQEPLLKKGIELGAELERITLALGGVQNKPGLRTRLEAAKAAVTAFRDRLDAPQKAYQTYLATLETWKKRKAEIEGTSETPDTIRFLEAQILAVNDTIPARVATMRLERFSLVKQIHAELLKIRKEFEALYKPVQHIATSNPTAGSVLNIQFDAFLTLDGFEERFLSFINQGRRGSFYGAEDGRVVVRQLIRECNADDEGSVIEFLEKVVQALEMDNRGGRQEAVTVVSQLAKDAKLSDLYDFLFSLGYMESRYTLKLGGKEISQLSPGEKGALLLVFYLLLDIEDVPIIIDQPEHNLDNESVVRLLAECVKRARDRRQVIIVTHNPNLAVFCDADQIICTDINKADGNHVSYTSGAIEHLPINHRTVDVLEGTYPAFDNRKRKYFEPKA